MWNRDTNWHQCSIISVEILRNYNPSLVRSLSEDITYLCVVSSNGDIINDNMMLEPVVEFVGAKRVDVASPEYTHAKHPSLLHLQCFLEGEQIALELTASPKLGLSKHNLIPAIQPDKKFFFEESAKATLQSWLSFRYRRQDLPQSFVSRTLPVWAYLKREGKKHAAHVMGYWISYDPRNDEIAPHVPYTFSLYIVYSSRHREAKEQAESLTAEIRSHFDAWKKMVKDAGEIELNECEAYGEDCFTLADLQNCVYFNLEQAASHVVTVQENKEPEDAGKV
jgi:hypothetical protein